MDRIVKWAGYLALAASVAVIGAISLDLLRFGDRPHRTIEARR